MATTHIATSFEEYADGVGPNEFDTLVDPTAGLGYGWFGGSYAAIPGDVGVVSSNSRTGLKAVEIEDGALPWQPVGGQNGDRYLAVEAWFKPGGVGSVRGPNIQISSAVGSSGTAWPIFVGASASGPGLDLEVYVFDVLVATVIGAFSTGAYQKLRIEVLLSTVEDGGSDVNADGYVKAFVDGVQVYNSGLIRVATNSVEWASLENGWFEVSFRVNGYVDDVSIVRDSTTTPGEIPPNNSTPCCGAGPGPGNPNPSSTPNPGSTPIPLQPWTPQCAGGGTVPSAADVTDLESWAL